MRVDPNPTLVRAKSSTLSFTCHLEETTTPLDHAWEHTIGSGHATLALRSDSQAQLRRCRDDLGFRHVRFHGLFCDDMGTFVEQGGEAICSFFNADRIFDFLLSIGMRPFVELGFMPKALASGEQTVFHYGANITAPKDPAKWAELVRTFVQHCVDRYGLDEVREWFFEVWNEPNLTAFWVGTQDDYFRFYRVTAAAVKQVDAALKVGGPATAKNEWIAEFLDGCQRHDAPVDFVSTHHYPGDAFGNESDDTEAQLAASRRGVLREQAQDAHRRAAGKPLYYTEWNASSNPRDPRHDQPSTAAFLVKTVLETNGLVRGYSWWTFSDIFEENYFPSQPYHGGFGLLNLYGIPKPSYRAFELLHALGTVQLLVDGLHPTVDAWAVRNDDALVLLLVNHAQPRHPIELEQVTFFVDGSPRPLSVSIQRIDDAHANPFGAWQAMGEPQYLDAVQVVQLEAASRLRGEPLKWKHAGERLQLDFALPVDGVAAVTVKFPAGGAPDGR